jgi:hypothetical protein
MEADSNTGLSERGMLSGSVSACRDARQCVLRTLILLDLEPIRRGGIEVVEMSWASPGRIAGRCCAVAAFTRR